MSEIIVREDTGIALPVRELSDAVRMLAAKVAEQNVEIAELKQMVMRLEKVSPTQARTIGNTVTERSKALCEKRRMQGCEAKVASVIRKHLKDTFGVSTVKDTPRIQYRTVLDAIAMWDDFSVLRGIRDAKGKTT